MHHYSTCFVGEICNYTDPAQHTGILEYMSKRQLLDVDYLHDDVPDVLSFCLAVGWGTARLKTRVPVPLPLDRVRIILLIVALDIVSKKSVHRNIGLSICGIERVFPSFLWRPGVFLLALNECSDVYQLSKYYRFRSFFVYRYRFPALACTYRIPGLDRFDGLYRSTRLDYCTVLCRVI